MKETLHVLHIEDSKEDCELIRNLLLKEGLLCDMKRVETRSELFDSLQNVSFDLILADYKLPELNGMQALEIACALTPEVPFIFVSGTMGEETAIESLRNGATDYVLKDRLSRLVPAVRRAMAEAEERSLCRQLQHRLREAGRMEAICTLSSGVAHDFNNILTIILSHSSLLATEYDNPSRVLEITGTIKQAAQRGAEVVQQLLAFARKSDSSATPLDVERQVAIILEQIKENLPPQLDLRFELAGNLPRILADSSQFQRILSNLVANAFESMPDGGRLTISTLLVPAREVPNLLPELASDRYVCIKVADTGAGMDPTTREHIFEPFFTTKERGRGTGLGLPVVFGLMQAHNALIDVDSEPGKGTTFSLFFPVPRQNPGIQSPVVHLSDSTLTGSETILVVEDEPDISFFLETILQSHGYHILRAHDYGEAVNVFKTHRDEIQLVLSDIGLPVVDGVTLCEEFKELKPGLKTILASGYSSKEFKTRLDKFDLDCFLSKPYTTNGILTSVRKVLDSSKLLRAC